MASWASYEAYLFDLDGTLIDTAPDINAALNFCLTQAGLATVNETLTRHWVGHGSRVLITQALQHQQAKSTDIDAMQPVFLDYYRNNLTTHGNVYPGVVKTLKRLKNDGAKLAVVTNKLTALSAPLLEQSGLTEFFDLIVCGDTAAAPKPDPAPVLACLQSFVLPNTAALFVGDSDTDVKAARAASVTVVCLRHGYNHGVDVETLGADGVIDEFEDLLL